jgi:hypothetical protein
MQWAAAFDNRGDGRSDEDRSRQRQLLDRSRGRRRRGLLHEAGEAPGQWLGELAAELGLSGEVDRDEYTALLAGKHRRTGDVLVKRPEPRTFVDATGRKRRLEPILGYDVRFSAPKSISLLWAVGSPEVQATIERDGDRVLCGGGARLPAAATRAAGWGLSGIEFGVNIPGTAGRGGADERQRLRRTSTAPPRPTCSS